MKHCQTPWQDAQEDHSHLAMQGPTSTILNQADLSLNQVYLLPSCTDLKGKSIKPTKEVFLGT